MPSYLSPGVYVEEIDRGSKPIEGAGTAVAAFVGFAEKGPIGEPTLVTNWSQFTNTFGGFIKGGYLAPAVYGYFNNGGGTCYVNRLAGSLNGEHAPKNVAVGALPGGQYALPTRGSATVAGLIVSPKPGVAEDVSVEVKAADDGAPADQFTVVVKQGGTEETFSNVSLGKGRNVRNVVETVNKESKLVQLAQQEAAGTPADLAPAAGTYALAVTSSTALVAADPRESAPVDANTFIGSADERTGVNGLELLDNVTMVCAPDIMAALQHGKINDEGARAAQQAMMDHCAAMRDRVAVIDCPPGMGPQQIREWRTKTANYDSAYAALYYPWIQIANPVPGGDTSILVPPSGHMAGVWARNDSERGVHKAPANEVVRGAIGLEKQISRNEQDTLNPVGVNCIRAFPGRGIRVWGARTLSSDPSWRYLNVRRLFNFVEKSIETGTQWVVFEPNDQFLWAKVVRDASAFLTRVWRDGALFGAAPGEAFFVKCDAELNPTEVRDAGQMICEIGIAPVKPAEFVIFRISQYSAS
jgi:phage tail sheath protein FI